MGERKGQNKYYPPDFDPAKHRSLDEYHGSHPLRERAKRLKSEGILIIRFEMPYNIWCDGCHKPIGMGVRYNAEKTKTGYYYTTPIYKFRMKCAMCDQHFEIQTDPKNQDYVILSGARRKEQRWDATQNEQVCPCELIRLLLVCHRQSRLTRQELHNEKICHQPNGTRYFCLLTKAMKISLLYQLPNVL